MMIKNQEIFELKEEGNNLIMKDDPCNVQSLPFYPKSFLHDIFIKENLFTIEKSLFDNSISLERDDFSLIHSNNEFNNFLNDTCDNLQEKTKIDLNSQNSIFPYKKNRNNFKSFILQSQNNYYNNYFDNKIKTINYNSSSISNVSNINITNATNSNIRSDSLLIRFKSFIGKWFIKYVNNLLKTIFKRKIKFFAFNYKKFTIIVSYSKNKKWLDEKIKDLLILGDDSNQIKNRKVLKSIYKKNFEEINKIKEILELTYRKIIELFYLSQDFMIFKNNNKIKQLNDNFIKIMNISLLDEYGFIKFFELRKGNIRKKKDNN